VEDKEKNGREKGGRKERGWTKKRREWEGKGDEALPIEISGYTTAFLPRKFQLRTFLSVLHFQSPPADVQHVAKNERIIRARV